MGVPRR